MEADIKAQREGYHLSKHILSTVDGLLENINEISKSHQETLAKAA